MGHTSILAWMRSEPVENQIRSGGFRNWKGDLRRAAGREWRSRSSLLRASSRSTPAGIRDAVEVGPGLEIGAAVARVRTVQQPSRQGSPDLSESGSGEVTPPPWHPAWGVAASAEGDCAVARESEG